MSEVCIVLSENPSIVAFMTPLEALIAQTALDFGRQCGILSTLDSFLEDLGIKNAAESAFKDVMNAASSLFNQINNIIDTLGSIYEDGLNLLLAGIESIYNIIDAAFTTLAGVMTSIANALKNALNAVTSAVCNTLSEALTGIPSNITFNSVGLQVANLAIDQIAAIGTNELIGNLLRNQNVSSFLTSLNGVRNTILNLPALPNVSAFVCVEV
jgi:phage-related protein